MENEKEKRIGANKRERVRWIRGKENEESQKEKGEENRTKIEGKKNVGEEEERGRKEKGDFPGVPTVESLRSES